MRRLAILAAALAGCDGGKTGDVSPPPRRYVYDAVEAWNAFAEGSSVEHDVERSGLTMRVTRVLEKRSADVITLKRKSALKLGDTQKVVEDAEEVRRLPAACASCGKDHAADGKWSEETIEIAGRRLACRVFTGRGCQGEDSTTWYSPEVPGHVVKSAGSRLVAFEARR